MRETFKKLAILGSSGVALTTAGVLGPGADATPGVAAPPSVGVAPITPLPLPAPGSTPESIASAQAQLNIPDVIDSAQQSFGSDYAGFWIDNSGALPVIHVKAVDSETARTVGEPNFLAKLGDNAKNQTDVTFVTFSESTLQSYVDAIGQYLNNNSSDIPAPGDNISIYVDTPDNAVGVVLSPQNAKLLESIQSIVPVSALRVSWNSQIATPASGWTSGVNDNTFPPYKSGLYVANPNGSHCTSGFLLEAGGAYKGVVAGHCDNTGDHLYSGGGSLIGTASSVWQWGLGGDYTTFALSSTYLGDILAEWSGSSGFVDTVRDREHSSDQGIGLSVCEAGVNTNAVSCGTLVYGAGAIETYDSHVVSNLACGTFNGNRGDSGGPVYVPYPGNQGNAAGVMDMVGPLWNCYTVIDSVLQGITNTTGYPAYVVDGSGGLH